MVISGYGISCCAFDPFRNAFRKYDEFQLGEVPAFRNVLLLKLPFFLFQNQELNDGINAQSGNLPILRELLDLNAISKDVTKEFS